MSDDDMYMDEEDYGFEYSDEEDDQPDVDIENAYFSAKALREDDPDAALDGFQSVVDMEPEKSEWGFKALKQTVKLQFKIGRHAAMLGSYKRLLTYIKSAVTRNYSEKSINSILDFVSTSNQMDLLQDFYETTLEALLEAKNDRLWFKTKLKLGKLLFDRKEYNRLRRLVKELLKSCQNQDGSDDQKKGTQLLEIYALEIQLYTETKDNKKLKALYKKALQIKAAIPHPRTLGVINESGGKMHMSEREWGKARNSFYEAFKNYDECGSPQRIQCLKYLVLAGMLEESDINPFDSQEAKAYKSDPEIVAMTSLVQHYMDKDLKSFERVLRENEVSVLADPFIKFHIDDLLRKIRCQFVLKLVASYSRLRLSFIADELRVDVNDVVDLLVGLILDDKIQGLIDQVNQVLELRREGDGAARYTAMSAWAGQLASMHQSVVSKVN